MKQIRQPSRNTQPSRRNVMFRHREASVLVFCSWLLLATSGCVTPWADVDSVKLPTMGATPTGDVPLISREPVDPYSVPVKGEELLNGSSLEAAAELEEPVLDQPTTTIMRGQTPSPGFGQSVLGNEPPREPMQASTASALPNGGARVAQYDPNAGYVGGASPVLSDSSFGQSYGYDQGPVYGGGQPSPLQSAQGYGPAYSTYDGSGVGQPYGGGPGYAPDGLLQPLPSDYADLVVNLRETQTGRFMFGVGVNSDLGLTAQAVIDERNFDWRRWPRSLSDVINGTAWRGGGQALRIEAVPGTQVQRYLINFTQPYLFDTLPISFNASAFLYDRRYFDWDEERWGGRIGLGYRITPDLSLSLSLRGEQVDLHDPRIRGIQQIEDVLGESDLFSGKVSLTHDTRDIPFAPTEGHYLELSYEQVFGTFDYPRANFDYRRYFLLRERIDRSGRHTLAFSFRGGITGSNTPVYENYFAGGYSTMRGFRFRHASPKVADVTVGGQLSLLGSAEYIFPVTADDMLRGALFCDYGTVEETYDNIEMDDFRVAIGAGLRINVPAMGPAPISVDFAVPIAREDTDRIQNFSFNVGFGR